MQTPRALIAAQRRKLSSHLEGLQEGNPDSVHDARVVSRRLRELLPLCFDAEQVCEGIRSLGRALGQVRECDVEIQLLNALERMSLRPRCSPSDGSPSPVPGSGTCVA